MERLGHKLPYNKRISGRIRSYDGWEFRPFEMHAVSGKSMLCLICYVTLPKDYHFFYAKYHVNTEGLHRLTFDFPIYSYVFIGATDALDAQRILNDVHTVRNPELVFEI